MNREQRRNLTHEEMKDRLALLAAENEKHEKDLKLQGFGFPPMVRFEILITTLADMAFGENTRKRTDFEYAVQERWAELFTEENVRQMKNAALDEQRRQQIIAGIDVEQAAKEAQKQGLYVPPGKE